MDAIRVRILVLYLAIYVAHFMLEVDENMGLIGYLWTQNLIAMNLYGFNE